MKIPWAGVSLLLLVLLVLQGPQACSSKTECEGSLSKLSLNPNNSVCVKHCECNNVNYTGMCIDQDSAGKGKCNSIQRPKCSSPGEPGLCVHHIHKCNGNRTCAPQELDALVWGDCVCANQEASTEPPPDAATPTEPSPDTATPREPPPDTATPPEPTPPEPAPDTTTKGPGYALIINGSAYLPNAPPSLEMSYSIWDMAQRKAIKMDLDRQVVDLDARIWKHYAFLFYCYHGNGSREDVVVVLDTSQFDSSGRWVEKARYKVGANAYPVDIAVINEKVAYLALHNKTFLLRLEPFTGKELKRVDLSSLAETRSTRKCTTATEAKCVDVYTQQDHCQSGDCKRDELPEPYRLLWDPAYPTQLHVLTHGLDRYATVYSQGSQSKLAIINTNTDLVETTLSPTKMYPTSFVRLPNGTYLIPEMNLFLDLGDGALELFDPKTKTLKPTPLNEEKVTKDGKPGSFLLYDSIAVYDERTAYATMASSYQIGTTPPFLQVALFVMRFDPKLGQKTLDLPGFQNGVYSHLAINNAQELYITDQGNKTLHILDAKTAQPLVKTTLPTSQSLPPLYIRYIRP